MLLLLKRIKIKTIIDGPKAITSDEGNILFQTVADDIKSGHIIELDFSGLTIVTSAFLNSSLGELHQHLTKYEIENCLKLVNIKKDYQILVDKVIVRSKQFHATPDGFEQVANNVIYGI
jgi:hypothetical protein